MNIIKGDLIELAKNGEFDLILHGCNCFHTMGGGIAKLVKDTWPSVFLVDTFTHKGDYEKLGNYSTFTVHVENNKPLIVINAYTQYHYNGFGQKTDLFEYAAFELILQKINHYYPNLRIGMPMIGMGLAGGDSKRILTIIEDFSKYYSGTVTVVKFNDSRTNL